MPSLAEVHGKGGGRSTDEEGGTGQPVSADDAAQVSLPLSTTGVVLFLLGIGFAFFFDSLLGTVGYLMMLGLGAWGLARWLVATIPSRDLPAFLTPNSRSTWSHSRSGPIASLRARLRSRLRQRHRSRSARSGRSRGNSTLLDRVRQFVRSVRSSKGGDRL